MTVREHGNARLFNAVAAVLLLVAVGMVAWAVRSSEASTPAIPNRLLPHALSIADDAILGARTAKVAIVEFSGFQCPFCAKFSRETLALLQKRYIDPGAVLLAFKHLPLDVIHPVGALAAEHAECAKAEGRFWQVQDALFAHPDWIDATGVRTIVTDTGVARERLTSCVSLGRARAKVEADVLLAYELGVTSTPTFLIGYGVDGLRVNVVSRISGNRPFDDFDQVLTKLLARNAIPAEAKVSNTK